LTKVSNKNSKKRFAFSISVSREIDLLKKLKRIAKNVFKNKQIVKLKNIKTLLKKITLNLSIAFKTKACKDFLIEI